MTPQNRGIIQQAQDLAERQRNTVDGHPRSQAEDQEISECVHRLLGTADGQKMFAWLRQITVNKVLGAQATLTELAYQEGGRAIIALIEKRRLAHESKMLAAEKKK